MKKNFLLLTLLIIFIVITTISCSNSSTKSSEDTSSNHTKDIADSSKYNDKSKGLSSSEAKTKSANNAILSKRKIIRNADLTISVKNFDNSYSKIKELVKPYGYIQESNINNDLAYDNSNQKITTGTIILRVDQNKLDYLLNKLGNIGQITNEHISSEDVTEKYYDVESRLRLIKFEQSRLEELLNKASNTDEIFKIEDKLTEIRQEIESLTVNLNKLDALVKLSTITLTITEKRTDVTRSKSFFLQLKNNLFNSTKNAFYFIGDLILLISKLLPFIILLLIFGFIIFIIIWFSQKKRRQFSEKNNSSSLSINKSNNKDS